MRTQLAKGQNNHSSASTPSPEPLLRSTARSSPAQSPPHPPARPSRLAAVLGRATGRRGPSMLVRETAALQLDRRRADWAYSRPVVALDIAWNLAFAAASAAVLAATVSEKPNTPVRVWIAGYALQCLVHVAMVWTEYKRRQRSRGRVELEDGGVRGSAAATAAEEEVANEESSDEEEEEEETQQPSR